MKGDAPDSAEPHLPEEAAVDGPDADEIRSVAQLLQLLDKTAKTLTVYPWSNVIAQRFLRELTATTSPGSSSSAASLIGRVTTIADFYDAVTSARVYIREPYPPDKALQLMWEKAGTAFDPALLKVFINCIGIFALSSG